MCSKSFAGIDLNRAQSEATALATLPENNSHLGLLRLSNVATLFFAIKGDVA